MNWGNVISSVLVALLGALGLWAGQHALPGVRWRRQLKEDLALLKEMSPSVEREKFEKTVRQQVLRLNTYIQENTGSTFLARFILVSICLFWAGVVAFVIVSSAQNPNASISELGGGLGVLLVLLTIVVVVVLGWLIVGANWADLPDVSELPTVNAEGDSHLAGQTAVSSGLPGTESTAPSTSGSAVE